MFYSKRSASKVAMGKPRTIRKILLVIGAVAALAIAIGGGFALYIIRSAVDGSAERQRAALAKHHQEFLDDQRFAATLQIFARRPGNRDAGPVLGPRVRWLLAPGAFEHYQKSLPEDMRGLLLDRAISQKLEKDWLKADPTLWAGLDFSWMGTLAEFDFWDLDDHSPAPFSAEYLHPATPSLELIDWAKLRLAKGRSLPGSGEATTGWRSARYRLRRLRLPPCYRADFDRKR